MIDDNSRNLRDFLTAIKSALEENTFLPLVFFHTEMEGTTGAPSLILSKVKKAIKWMISSEVSLKPHSSWF